MDKTNNAPPAELELEPLGMMAPADGLQPDPANDAPC